MDDTPSEAPQNHERLQRAHAHTRREFASSGRVGQPTCCAATVSISLPEEVACPGHDHQIDATGAPAGGTFEWHVSSGATLVDAAGAPTTSGARVFLRSFRPNNSNGSIPERQVAVSVVYRNPACGSARCGVARARRTITVHSIRFMVTNMRVQTRFEEARVDNPARLWIQEEAGTPNNIHVLPDVEIRLHSSCPRKPACASSHTVGWLQTVRGHHRRARYSDTVVEWILHFPIIDLHPAFANAPFYGPTAAFVDDRGVQHPEHFDAPSMLAPVVDARPGAPAPPPANNLQLRSVRFGMTFTAWLTVRNTEWAVRFPEASFLFLRHFEWHFDMQSRVDMANPVPAHRVRPQRTHVIAGSVGSGQGSHRPTLTGDSYNIQLNTPANVHASAASHLP